MATEELNQLPAVAAAQAASTPARKGWIWVVVIGCLATIAAWGAMMANPGVSLACAIAGIILSLPSAIGVGKGLWRDLGITCVIASAVLLLVYAIFYYGLAYVIKSLG